MSGTQEERIEELNHRIAELRQEVKVIEQWENSVRSLDSFSDKAKIHVFDALYKQARTYLKTSIEVGYEPKDAEYYLYEAVVSKTLGPGAWPIINSVAR